MRPVRHDPHSQRLSIRKDTERCAADTMQCGLHGVKVTVPEGKDSCSEQRLWESGEPLEAEA